MKNWETIVLDYKVLQEKELGHHDNQRYFYWESWQALFKHFPEFGGQKMMYKNMCGS